MANIKLGETLRKLRNENGYTQQEVANLLGLKNKSTLGSWEVGKSEPDGYTFLKLCKLYHVIDIYATFSDSPASDPLIILTNTEKIIISKYREADEITKELVHRSLGMDTQINQDKMGKIS